MSTPIDGPYNGAFPLAMFTSAYSPTRQLTYADSATVIRMLVALEKWINTELIKGLTSEVTRLLDGINKYKDELQKSIDALEADTATKLADLDRRVQEAVDLLVGNSVELQAYVVEAIFGDENSKSRKILDQNYRRVWTPELFGAKGDGIADDTLALKLAITAVATEKRRSVVDIRGTYKQTDSFTIDTARTILEGPGQITCAMNDPSKFAVLFTSTDDDPVGSPVRQSSFYIDGVVFMGDGKTNGFRIHGAGNIKVAHYGFRNITVTRFKTGIQFGRNAYMHKFSQSNITLCNIGLEHTDEGNSGERLSFVDCDITGHGLAIKQKGQAFHFIDCSFSYILRRVLEATNGGISYFTNCHIEMYNAYANHFFVSGNGGAAFFDSCRFLFRDQTTNAVSLVFAGNTSLVKWPNGNPRDRYQPGDPFKFSGIVGPTTVNSATVYYFKTVSDEGFTLTATKNADGTLGDAIGIDQDGTATGILSVQGAAIFNAATDTSMIRVRGGHIGGSSDVQDSVPFVLGEGPGSFTVKDTQGTNLSKITFLTREMGDLVDGDFNRATIGYDEWSWSGLVSAPVVENGKLKITKTAAGAAQLVLNVPLREGARWIWEFLFTISSDKVVNHQAAYKAHRTATKLPALYSSDRGGAASAGVETRYSQRGFNALHAPVGVNYIEFVWTLTNLAQGDSFYLDKVKFSAL